MYIVVSLLLRRDGRVLSAFHITASHSVSNRSIGMTKQNCSIVAVVTATLSSSPRAGRLPQIKEKQTNCLVKDIANIVYIITVVNATVEQ